MNYSVQSVAKVSRYGLAISIGCGALWLAVLVFGVSDGGDSWELFLFIFGSWVLVLVWLILGPAVWLFLRSSRAGPVERLPWWVNGSVPVVVLCAIGVMFTPMPNVLFKLRFAASRPALERYVASAREGKVDLGPHPSRRVGLLWVRETEALPEAVRLITTGCELLDDCGIVFSPGGKPPRIGEDVYSHLDGPWWFWFRSW